MTPLALPLAPAGHCSPCQRRAQGRHSVRGGTAVHTFWERMKSAKIGVDPRPNQLIKSAAELATLQLGKDRGLEIASRTKQRIIPFRELMKSAEICVDLRPNQSSPHRALLSALDHGCHKASRKRSRTRVNS